jgi:small-conductance mechanosensitive channel
MWLEQQFYHNTVQNWLIALAVMLAVVIGSYIIIALLRRRLKKIAVKTKTDIDDLVVDILQRTKFLFLLIFSLFIASRILDLPDKVAGFAVTVFNLSLLLQSAVWGIGVINFITEKYKKQKLQEDAASATTFSALGFVGKLVLWSLVLLMALDNLGFDITALVAGLGISGIAIALAVQNILGDLLASLSIVMDKPFVLGDFIIVDNHLGSVEHVGLKTTRIRSLSGEQLIFSNNDLLNSRIRNFKRMAERRVVFGLGVTYQTPADKLKKIPVIIRETIEARESIRFDRAHFKDFGDFSLNFEIVYWIVSPDYTLYMDIQQEINLELYNRFAQESIEFAYPTQTLFVENQAQ